MTTFTNTAYFYGSILLPQAQNQFQTVNVEDYIRTYEPEILRDLLGQELYLKVQKAWDDFNDDNSGGLDARYETLIRGGEFSISIGGELCKLYWGGLVNDIRISLLSYFVFTKYIGATEVRTTSIGSGTSKKENTKRVSPMDKIARAHNDCIKLYGTIPANVLMNAKKCPEYWLKVDNYDHYNVDASAYNFLLSNKSDYPEWRFKPRKQINVLGI